MVPGNNKFNPLTWLLGWIGRHEPIVLIALGVLAAALWIFVELADEVVEKETHPIDRNLLLLLRNPDDARDPLGPPWVESMLRDVTALGSIVVLTFLILSVAGYLLLTRKLHAAVFLLAAVTSGLLLGVMLKNIFGRPRPDLVAHHDHVLSASFPSNHSLMSAVVYLTLGALLARVEPSFRLKAYFLLLAVVITIAVGISRVYLGVHWPSDVLAGWTLGAAWAISCWLLTRWLQRRGQVEKG